MKLKNYSNNTPYLSPSLLAADFANLESEMNATKKAGVEIIHLDVMDGHFVPNISIGPPVISSLRAKSDLLFDVHLMLTHPIDYIESFVKAGADHITFHLEADSDIAATIALIHSLGASAGLSVKPGTPIEGIFPYLDSLEMILIMTVEPGFGGQKFMPEMLEKVSVLRSEIDRRSLTSHIEVDGGVNSQNSPLLIEAGANILVAGTSFFGDPQGKDAALRGILTSS